MPSPSDIIVPAGKTIVLTDGTNVCLVKDAPADKPTRVFTAWTSAIYDSNAAALADIKAKNLKYVVPAPIAKPTPPAAK